MLSARPRASAGIVVAVWLCLGWPVPDLHREAMKQTEPNRLTAVGPSSAYGPQLAVVGGWAYVPDGTGLLVIDGRDPARPRLVGRVPMTMTLDAVVADNDRLYGAAAEGLWAFDLADPARPVPVMAYHPAPLKTTATSGVQGLVGAGDGAVLLEAIDCTADNTCQRHLESVTMTTDGAPVRHCCLYREGAWVSGDWLFIQDRQWGIGWTRTAIGWWRIADPVGEHMVGGYGGDVMTEVRSPILMGEWLYVLRSGWSVPPTLDVVSFADPANPQRVAEWPDLPALMAAATDRGWVWMPDGLQILDLTIPTHPIRRGALRFMVAIATFVLNGPRAWVLEGGGWRRLFIVDATNMDAPVVIAELPLVARNANWAGIVLPYVSK